MTAPPPAPDSQPPTPDAKGGRGFLRHAAVISVLTFASRLLGLVRDRIMGSVFGTSPWHAAFVIGFIVPNLFRRLFGEGALVRRIRAPLRAAGGNRSGVGPTLRLPLRRGTGRGLGRADAPG